MKMQAPLPPNYQNYELNSTNVKQAALESKKENSQTEKEEYISLKEKVSEWAERTSLEGVPNLTNSNSHTQRYAWLIIMIAGLGMLIYQVQDSIYKYYSYPSSVTFSQEIETPLSFPALTFCNLNPVRISAMSGGGTYPNGKTQSSSVTNLPQVGRRRRDAPNPLSYQPPGDSMKNLLNLSSVSCLASCQNYNGSLADQSDTQVSPDAGVRFYFQDIYQQLSLSKRLEYGSQLSNFLVDCTINNMMCKPANFTTFLHPTMGPCFTFNANSTISSKFPGPLFGFEGIFFVEEDQYFGALSRTVGVRLVVHHPSRMPLPDEEGINLATGMDTAVAVSTKYISRLKPPYVDACREYTDDENVAMNLYAKKSGYSLPNVKMNFDVCVRTCIQNSTEKICNCSNPFFPRTNASEDPVELDTAQGFTANNSTRIRPCYFGYCNGVMGTQYSCFMKVREDYDQTCQDSCSRECLEYHYETKVSIANWPSSNYGGEIQKKVQSRCTSIKSAMSTMIDPGSFVTKNLVKVSVHFETLSVDKTESQASYEVVQLLADFGGQFGLWMGLSVLTMFEVAELLIELVFLIGKKVRRVKKSSTWVSTVREVQKKGALSSDDDLPPKVDWSQS